MNNTELPETLPLIEKIIDKFTMLNTQPLKKYYFLGIQHLQGTTIPLVNALHRMGIDYNMMFLVGKAYSTHQLVVADLLKKGCNVSDNHTMRDYTAPYEDELEVCIDKVLKQIIPKAVRDNAQVLLFDEGGKAVKIVHEKYPDALKLFKAVEQTSRGIKLINMLDLKIPVVNVARSRLKLEIEAPFIAESMFNEIVTVIDEWKKLSQVTSMNILLIGYGVIGKNLAKLLLRHDYTLSVYDVDHRMLEDKNHEHYTVPALDSLDKNIADFSIIIGCTGALCLNYNALHKLRTKTLLINGASSDIEFPAWELRKKATIVNSSLPMIDSRTQYYPWKNLYKIGEGDRAFFLANGGFPINFSGKVNPIPPIKFQITRALMFAGGLQVAGMDDCLSGVFELGDAMQDFIFDTFHP